MRDRPRVVLLAAYAAMGATSASYPAAIPAISGTGGGDPLLGIPLLFGALLLGTLAAAALHRLDPRRLLLIGTLIEAIALLLAPVAFLPACLIAGLGFGLAEASANLLTRLLAAERTAAALAGMTGAVALAAALCPVLVALLGPVALAWLAIIPVLAALAGALWRGPLAAEPSPAVMAPMGARPRLLPIVAAIILFVGVETVVSGWSAVLPERLLELDAGAAAIGTSAFWLLMSLGRVLARLLVGRAMSSLRYLVVALGAAAVLLALAAVLGERVPWLGLGIAAVATLLLAPGYSLVLGAALVAIPAAAARRATGVLVALGAVGGSLVPLAVALAVGTAPGGTLGIAAGLLLAVVALAAVHARVTAR